MKLSKAEYEELIREKPSLRPTEVTPNIGGAIAKAYGHSLAIKSQNAHGHLSLPANVQTTITSGPYEFGEPNGSRVTIIQEKLVKSSTALCFTIPGQPVGKPRQTRSDVWKKRPCVMRYREWADTARASVPSGAILSTYRQIAFVAYLEIPKSYSMTRRHILAGNPHYQKPDGDNILKAILDSLFPEDKVIWKFSGEKRWDDGKGSRIEVELR